MATLVRRLVTAARIYKLNPCMGGYNYKPDFGTSRAASSASGVSSVKAALPSKPDPVPQTEDDEFSLENLEQILEEQEADHIKTLVDNDMPIPGLSNPYEPPPKKCILCQYSVQLDYKNVRLLSQFVSPYTGQIYGRHITGMCIYMQKRIAKLIKRARIFGYMPVVYKEPIYIKDPKLYDPFKRV